MAIAIVKSWFEQIFIKRDLKQLTKKKRTPKQPNKYHKVKLVYSLKSRHTYNWQDNVIADKLENTQFDQTLRKRRWKQSARTVPLRFGIYLNWLRRTRHDIQHHPKRLSLPFHHIESKSNQQWVSDNEFLGVKMSTI